MKTNQCRHSPGAWIDELTQERTLHGMRFASTAEGSAILGIATAALSLVFETKLGSFGTMETFSGSRWIPGLGRDSSKSIPEYKY